MVSLARLTEEQNVLLTQLSYKSHLLGSYEGLSVSEILETVSSKSDLGTLLSQLSEKGFGDLVLQDVAHNEASGFGAVAFKNPTTGEVGMTFRGTDNLDELISDAAGIFIGDQEATQNQIDMIDNVATAVTGGSVQAQEAIAFYEANKVGSSGNYLFGHSKGGELASEVFAVYHEEIQEVHVMNPQPINWTKLTPEQQKAFNSSKFDALVIDGDIVWLLGGVPYQVRIVKNNGSDESFFGPHHLSSIQYDEYGNAVIEEEPYTDYNKQGLAGLLAVVAISTVQAGYAVGKEIVEIAGEVYEFVTKDIPAAAKRIYESIVATYEKVKDRVVKIKNNIESFFATVAKAISNWSKKFNAGYQYASTNTYIKVDTAKLRNYANRLKNVNKRLEALDERMNGLYTQVGLQGLLDLLTADMLTGYCSRLTKCANYLTDTAAEFEAVERSIASQA